MHITNDYHYTTADMPHKQVQMTQPTLEGDFKGWQSSKKELWLDPATSYCDSKDHCAIINQNGDYFFIWKSAAGNAYGQWGGAKFKPILYFRDADNTLIFSYTSPDYFEITGEGDHDQIIVGNSQDIAEGFQRIQRACLTLSDPQGVANPPPKTLLHISFGEHEVIHVKTNESFATNIKRLVKDYNAVSEMIAAMSTGNPGPVLLAFNSVVEAIKYHKQ